MAENEVPVSDETETEAPEQLANSTPVDGDAYIGPLVDDIVGDDRRLRLVSINPITGEDHAELGEVWQDDQGALHGSGLAAVMLFEPMSAARYQSASLAVDMSPLTVFYVRMARSSFIRAEFVEVPRG